MQKRLIIHLRLIHICFIESANLLNSKNSEMLNNPFNFHNINLPSFFIIAEISTIDSAVKTRIGSPTTKNMIATISIKTPRILTRQNLLFFDKVCHAFLKTHTGPYFSVGILDIYMCISKRNGFYIKSIFS